MKHLLNCKQCDYNEIIEGPSMVADVRRESHEESIRNALSNKEHCPKDSVAWVTLPKDVAQEVSQR